MRVLFINETCGQGSHGRICTDLLDILHELGHDGRIAYGRGNAPTQYADYAVRVGSKVDTYFHAASSRIFDNAGFCSGRATEKLLQQIEAYRPDIIHLHNIHGYYIHVGILFDYLSKCNKPVIWTLHDSWALTGHCTCSDYIGCSRWKTGCYECPQKGNYPASYLWDRSKNNYQMKKRLFTSVKNMQLVTPSTWLKTEAEQSFLKQYPVRVIRSGIDLNVFRPTPSDFREKYGLTNRTILLSVANAWSQRKGLDAIEMLARQLDARYQIVMVGRLHGEKVPDKVLHIEHTANQEELAQIYTAADVYMNLSYEETQGLTTTEALACGTPAIVSNRTAIPESIDESCGIVVDSRNIQSVLSGIEKARALNAADCVRHASNYEKRNCFMRYIDLYKEICR